MADQVAVTKVIEVDVKASAQAAAHLKQIADGMQPIQGAAEKASGSLGSMLSMVRGLAVFQIIDAVGEKVMAFAGALQEASDKSRVLEERMKLVSGSTTEAATSFQSIIDISIRQGRELDSVAKLYEKMQRSSEALALTQRGVSTVTEGVAASLRLAGAGTQEANAAMLQFAQAMASGKLGGDEFRSLMENDSVLMQAFAKELHTTMGGLREMSKEGKLTADVLRDAMFRIGEDGKNMMQRMIEAADKLPKTFAQAVTGMKSSLVDLVNALQASGDKTEGIFTKIVKSLTDSFREAARMIRLQAKINEEIARLMDQQLNPPQKELTGDQKYIDYVVAQKARAQEALNRAEAQMALQSAAQVNNANWSKSRGYQLLADNIKRAKGELDALTKEMGQLWEKQENQDGRFVTGPAQKTTKDDKPKGRKPDTAADVMEAIREDLEGEALTLQNMLAGQEKAVAKLDETLAKIDRVPIGKETSATIAEFKAWAHRQAEENAKTAKELEWANQQRSPETAAFFTNAVQKSDERVREVRRKAIEKIKEDAEKDRLTQDPFVGAEAEVAFLKSLLVNPENDEAVSNEVAEIIFKRIDQVREKAAIQAFGQHDPLKSVAEQMADNFGTAFDRMEDDMLDFSKSAKDIAGDLVVSLLRDFAKLQLKETMTPFMEEGKGWMKTGIKALMDYFTTSADGSGWGPGGVRLFASGGILGGPTMFQHGGGLGIAGEAGPEAVMPLKRGSDGNLGVGATPVTVNIFNSTNSTTRTEESTNSNGERQIDVYIEEKVGAMIGSGRLDNVMGNSYGISRRGR